MNTIQLRRGASEDMRSLPSAPGMITALLLYLGMCGCFLARIAESGEMIVPLIAGAVLIVLLPLLCRTRPGSRIAFYLICAGFAACLFALDLPNGLCAVANRVSNAIGARIAYNLPRLNASEDALPTALCVLSMALALGCMWIVRVRASCIAWLIALLLFLPDALLHMTPPHAYIAAMVCGLLLLRLPPQGGFSLRGLTAVICFLLVFAIAFAAICVPSLSPRLPWLDALHETAARHTDDYRFGTASRTGLPQGDFSQISDLRRTDAPMLEITMSRPESLYLRGYIGSDYRENGWRAADPESLRDGSELFYWLHRDHFYGETQLAALAAQIEPGDAAPIEIQIRHTGARRDMIYAPYELISADNDLPAAGDVGDIRLRRLAVMGLDRYTLTSAENLVSRYAALSRALSEKEGGADDAPDTYLRNESHYNRFVYAHFLNIPEDARKLMASLFGALTYTNNAHMDYAQAKQRILNWLNDNITYTESVPSRGAEADFLADFLTRSKAGYDVHYAAAATMMMRYFGIPARYVEGYLITPDTAAAAQAGAAFALVESDAHAWTEIYQDGVGWIPFETAPNYLTRMPQEDRLAGSAPEQNGTQEAPTDDTPLPENSLDMTEDFHEDPDDPDAEHQKTRFPYALLLILPALLLIALIVLLLRRCMDLLQRRHLFRLKDRRAAVLNLYAELFALMRRLYNWPDCIAPSGFERTVRADMGEDMAIKYMQIIDICRHIAFSEDGVAEPDYQFVYNFVQKTRRLAKKRLPLRRRWNL